VSISVPQAVVIERARFTDCAIDLGAAAEEAATE
jgi:hypothetical protein